MADGENSAIKWSHCVLWQDHDGHPFSICLWTSLLGWTLFMRWSHKKLVFSLRVGLWKIYLLAGLRYITGLSNIGHAGLRWRIFWQPAWEICEGCRHHDILLYGGSKWWISTFLPCSTICNRQRCALLNIDRCVKPRIPKSYHMVSVDRVKSVVDVDS